MGTCDQKNNSGAMGQSVRPANGKFYVRIPAATDLSRKSKQGQLHCQTLGIKYESHGPSEMTIINGCPVSQQLWHAKEPSLLSKCRAQVKICSPSPVMLRSQFLNWTQNILSAYLFECFFNRQLFIIRKISITLSHKGKCKSLFQVILN